MLAAVVLAIAIGMWIARKSFNAVMTKLPYVSGLLGVLFLVFAFPSLKDIIPGESKASIIAVILIIEAIIFVLVKNEQTSGPMVAFSSMFFIGLAMIVVNSSIEYPSWQKAVLVTVIYLISAGFVIASNFASTGEIRATRRNIVASILVAFLYAATVAVNLLVILGYIWAKYIKANYSEGFYKAFDNGGLVIIAGAMIVTIAVSLVRDRRQELLVAE
ncbi:hypothetical protein [Butyrivibrio sp. AE3009]|uniref:hypothetical protein n=1 Tax=Butyrivibrio sp. AE3009 TaxID=1280666 RepID=UPI0003B31185|nr:hypothetical protein [Butyrivibrio sp. AE3009]